MKNEILLFVDGARGVYIPRDFARTVVRAQVCGVEPDAWEELEKGPEGEFYWEAWDRVTERAVLTDPETGNRFKLYQDDSLFLIPENWEWDGETESFCEPEGETLQRFTLFSHWASYLVNGDASGLEPGEQENIDAFVSNEGLSKWTCADVSEAHWFGRPDCGGLRGDVARFTFVLIGETEPANERAG